MAKDIRFQHIPGMNASAGDRNTTAGLQLFKDAVANAKDIPTELEAKSQERRENATMELLKMKADGKNVTQKDIDAMAGKYNVDAPDQKSFYKGSEDFRRYEEKAALARANQASQASYRTESLKNQRLNAVLRMLNPGKKSKGSGSGKYIDVGKNTQSLLSQYPDMDFGVARSISLDTNEMIAQGVPRDKAIAAQSGNIVSDKGIIAQMNPWDSEFNQVEEDVKKIIPFTQIMR